MARHSSLIQRPLFIQRREDALRHVNQLAKGLKKVAIAGLVGAAGFGLIAVFLSHFPMGPSAQSSAVPGFREMSGITYVAWFLAIALLVFSSLYSVAGWGLSHKKGWARYVGTAAFVAKVLLCVWLGRSSASSMIVFLLIAGWDFYGLWVLLSKETGQLFCPPESSPTTV